MKPKRTTCTFHCAVCDLHCSCLAAFDAHRRNGVCLAKPKTTKSQAYMLRSGICNLTKGQIGKEVPAEVWGLPGFTF